MLDRKLELVETRDRENREARERLRPPREDGQTREEELEKLIADERRRLEQMAACRRRTRRTS
jgi:hypothetical protein